MRLSIQGCVILWLCFFSANTFAGIGYDWQSNGSFSYSTPEAAAEGSIPSQRPSSYHLDSCIKGGNPVTESGSSWGACLFRNYPSTWVTDSQGVYWKLFPDECVALSHEPNPITGQTGSTNMNDCSCDEGYIPGGGVPGEGQFDCVIPPQPPEECQENGQLYDPEKGYCVLECEESSLNGACLPDPEPEGDCNAPDPVTGEGGSSDYRGQVVLGYGKDPINACGDFDQCSGDKPGQVGFMNGELRCIPEDYGVPKCEGGSITVMDEYGFICSTLENKPEEPETPEAPNTDTDGDGEPDEYQKDNDPNINRKQLDDLKKSQDDANKSLGNLEQLGKSGNKILKDIEGNTGKSANELKGMGESLSDIKKNTKDSADNLQNLVDGLTAPEGGYGLGELGDIPTLSETASDFKATIMGTSIAQSIDGLTGIASNTTCPVWTIPKTKFWDAIPMTSHCEALENQRATLGTIFMFFWTGIAMFTFFKA